MTKANSVVAGLLLAATAIVPAAKAVTIEINAVGASAPWTTAALGVYDQLAGAGAGHYTVKGTCPSGNCAQVHDVCALGAQDLAARHRGFRRQTDAFAIPRIG